MKGSRNAIEYVVPYPAESVASEKDAITSTILSKSVLALYSKGIVFHASDPRSGECPLTRETYSLTTLEVSVTAL
jgi:hypothetical protein